MTAFAVGIVRCNEPRHILAETLDAIAASSQQPALVAMVDNGDTPLDTYLWSRVSTYVRHDRNLGCAGGWNQLYRMTGKRRTVILNADCAVAPDTFEKMVAVPAPAVVLAYGFGCFLIDEEIRQRVGTFDEDFYPVYFEDTDYRRRMKLAGIEPIEWPIVLDQVIVPGRERVTTGITHGSYDPDGYQGWRGDKLAWFRDRYECNKLLYAAKWGGPPGEETFGVPFGGHPELPAPA